MTNEPFDPSEVPGHVIIYNVRDDSDQIAVNVAQPDAENPMLRLVVSEYDRYDGHSTYAHLLITQQDWEERIRPDIDYMFARARRLAGGPDEGPAPVHGQPVGMYELISTVQGLGERLDKLGYLFERHTHDHDGDLDPLKETKE